MARLQTCTEWLMMTIKYSAHFQRNGQLTDTGYVSQSLTRTHQWTEMWTTDGYVNDLNCKDLTCLEPGPEA
ncbi:hypothetical protein CHARACLAT_021746 [Characodon lateralis]|uniref:Uncharacterized protein n=1 Tax=Characodon lateralis TaxID=208331 RepID=A0ABU7EVR4_9TELE|nr:hypothetical protein [Characodon lateralis]